MHLCWSAQDILDRIADLPAAGPLPRRTVVVPRTTVAHRLRCSLIQRQRADLLAGTAFVTVRALASEVLRAAGVRYIEGEDALRLPRLRVLFRGGLDPEYFRRDLVTSTPGWEEALARTVGDLERAGLTAGDLGELRTPLGRGLARVWQALDQAAGLSVTRAGMVARAAAALAQAPGLAGDRGSILALVTGYVDGIEARLIRALPGAQVAFRAVQPVRPEYLERVEAVLGTAARAALEQAIPPAAGPADLGLLRRYLFASPEVQTGAGRARAGVEPDGTVALEEHAGVAAEIEATADWVARLVLEQGLPLAEVAVLVPRHDPLAQLVGDRLRRLPWEGPFPVFVAGGVPLTSSSSGGRLLVVVEALRAHLSMDAVARVLPLLQIPGEGQAIAQGAALDLAQSLGTVGGSAAHPQGAMEWASRLASREAALVDLVDRARQAEGDEEQAGLARGRRDTERLLRDLQAARPGLEQLVQVARGVNEGASLADIWPLLEGFLRQWVAGAADAEALAWLAQAIGPYCDDADCRKLAGRDALSLVEATLQGLSVPVGRCGEPAVFVGTVSSAAGLSFQAVRVIGLVDGTIPAAPQEDTVLPDALRQQVGSRRVTTAADAALRSQHELCQLVQDTGRELVLSAPRLGLNRSYREPSSVFLEAAAALGRPAADGAAPTGIPSLEAIRQHEFGPARERAAAFRRTHPVGETAWQDRVADDRRHQTPPAIPSPWLAAGELSLDRIADLQHTSAATMDGILGADAQGPFLPGLERRRPLSASRWRTFLTCPHRFLYEHLLGWEEPAGPRSQRELDALAYGSLCHQVLARFFGESGSDFWGRKRSLPEWQQAVARIATVEFADLLEQCPLAGASVRQQQLNRVQGEMAELVEYLWSQGPSRFVAAEQPFGFDSAVALAAGATTVYVRGFIDLIDVDRQVTRLWDVKTGRCHPRRGKEAAPVPALDAQLALYSLAARAQARQWGTTDQLQAAYVHTSDRQGRLREFAQDFADLETAGRHWLQVTAGLLTERSFPRTPSASDCTYCPFLAVCGKHAAARSAALLAQAGGALQAFAEVRQ